MNDELLMNNYLLILKGTTEVYVHGTIEASNNDIRCILKENLNDILTNQAKTFDEITKRGWYQVNNIEKKEIKKTLNQLKK